MSPNQPHQDAVDTVKFVIEMPSWQFVRHTATLYDESRNELYKGSSFAGYGDTVLEPKSERCGIALDTRLVARKDIITRRYDVLLVKRGEVPIGTIDYKFFHDRWIVSSSKDKRMTEFNRVGRPPSDMCYEAMINDESVCYIEHSANFRRATCNIQLYRCDVDVRMIHVLGMLQNLPLESGE